VQFTEGVDNGRPGKRLCSRSWLHAPRRSENAADNFDRPAIRPHCASHSTAFATAKRCARGLTLVELALVIGILAVLMSIGGPAWQQYRNKIRVDQAKRDIIMMSAGIERYWQDARAYPDSLADAGFGAQRDPWGNPYGYLNLGDAQARGHARKDHSLVPINTDFDLYSMGADGRSAPPLTAAHSRDDIVRANNGAFVGPASEY
jgi:general secretion pathway protein G